MKNFRAKMMFERDIFKHFFLTQIAHLINKTLHSEEMKCSKQVYFFGLMGKRSNITLFYLFLLFFFSFSKRQGQRIVFLYIYVCLYTLQNDSFTQHKTELNLNELSAQCRLHICKREFSFYLFCFLENTEKAVFIDSLRYFQNFKNAL